MTVIHSQPSGYFNNDGTFQQFEETNQNPSDSRKYRSDLLSRIRKELWLTVLKCDSVGLSKYSVLQVLTV